MDLNLKNKIIAVTGGARGIGLAICKCLAQEGAIPFIIGRNKQDILQAIRNNPVLDTAQYAVAELTDPVQCERAVDAAIESSGSLHGLVNNAGVNDGVGLEHGNHADFIRSLERNVVHYYNLARLMLPALKESKGAIVNIGSKTSLTGQGGTSGYAAANGARNALTREWAVELLPYGIRVNTVIVAESNTPQYEQWIKKFDDPVGKLASITSKIPLGKRMTKPEEIVNTVTFLLSEKSSHTTGQIIVVDGGYTHLDRALT